MNWQGVVASIAIVGVFVCGYWLYTVVPEYAIAMHASDGWRITHTGWSLFIPGSLFLFPCLLFSLLLTFFLSLYVLKFAQDQDHKEKLNDYKAHFSKLERRAIEAEQRAKAEYQTALSQAEQTTTQAYLNMQEAMALETKSKEVIIQAQESIQAAQLQAQRATKKKHNAMGAAERIKRKNLKYS